MRVFFSILACFFLLSQTAVGQDIATLEKQLKTVKDPARLADINNLLAQAYLKKDGAKAITYAKASVKYAKQVGNKVVQAEALSAQAKATAGMYYPDKTVPNRRNKSSRQYYDAENLFKNSNKLATATGYTQLQLDNLENLAYINTKRIGRHDPSPRMERQYYREYIDLLKKTKKVTKPTPTVTTPAPTTSNSNNNFNRDMLEREKNQLKAKVRKLEGDVNKLRKEVTSLKKKLKSAKNDLKKALDSGTSEEEIKRLKAKNKEDLETLEKLEHQSKSDKQKHEKERGELQDQLDEATLESQLAALKASRFQRGLVLGGIIAALVLAFLYFGYRTQSRARKNLAEKNEEIAQEKERSEELLLNILPEDIAYELKENGVAKARRHDNVTVLFSDFKNFTKISETLSPEGLVKELDYCFKGFDYIISQYPSIEKIKTIGDAYMCCSGLSNDHRQPAIDMVKAAMDMQEFLYDYKAERQNAGMPFFEARIGIHTGAVVSGVVGSKKFAYDVWGDTVNVASRMESNGGVGKVNISANTYEEVRYQFSCHPRGKIEAKNKGLIEMYFVDKGY